MPFPKKLRVPVNEEEAVLLVGNLGEYLEKFATEILQEADATNQTVKVHTTNKLPVAGDNTDDLCISLVVCIIDVRSKESLITIKKCVQSLPMNFFMGRLLFVGLNVSDENRWCIGPEEISVLAKACESTVLWGEISTASTLSVLPTQILRKVHLLSSQLPYTSSLTTSGW